MGRRRDRGPSTRPAAVVLALGGIFIGGYRWLLPLGDPAWPEVVLRVLCGLLALVCFLGAVDLWFMDRRH